MSWPLSTFLVPNFDGALMDALHNKGGFRIVNTQAQMLSIPYLYRTLNSKEGTIVFLRDSKILYQLISNPTSDTTSLTDWEVIEMFGTLTPTHLPSRIHWPQEEMESFILLLVHPVRMILLSWICSKVNSPHWWMVTWLYP